MGAKQKQPGTREKPDVTDEDALGAQGFGFGNFNYDDYPEDKNHQDEENKGNIN